MPKAAAPSTAAPSSRRAPSKAAKIKSLPSEQRRVCRQLIGAFRQYATPPRLRTLREFAEQSFWIPEGRFKGRRFRAETLPWTGAFIDAIDGPAGSGGRYRTIILTGCVQGGKTLIGFDLLLAYHLCEWGETVVAGVPNMRTAHDKWRTEIKPVLAASPDLARFLPTTGKGSQGGEFSAITLANQAELNFMGGGGGDEARSHYTTRVAIVTEANRLGSAGEQSDEAAPIYQIWNRVESYGDEGLLYAECTTTNSHGFTEVMRLQGTASVLVKPCPHCGEYVAPERPHFVGLGDCTSVTEARLRGTFTCPACAAIITEAERRDMCLRSVLLHKGQTIDRDGTVHGEHPDTDILGFRFAAFDNLLWTTEFIAAKCYEAQTSPDSANALKNLNQMTWVEPQDDELLLVDLAPLTAAEVLDRQQESLPRGVAPAWASVITAAADVRATQIHFVVLAHALDGPCHLVDFGVMPTHRERYGVAKGVRLALRALDKRLALGVRTADGRALPVGWTPIDTAWKTDIVRAFVRERRLAGAKNYLTSFGRGAAASKQRGQYRHPTAETPQIPKIGDQYHLKWHDKHAVHALFSNADHWKTQVRERFATPLDQPGAITVFDAATEADQRELAVFAAQLTAEQPIEKIVPERGPVLVWRNPTGRANHFFDTTYLALVASHLQGVRVLDEEAGPAASKAPLLGAITVRGSA
jgi:phage terminase large subunit GpA-like protein